MFGDIVATGLVWIVPIAGECSTKNWVEGLLYASGLALIRMLQVQSLSYPYGGLICQPLR